MEFEIMDDIEVQASDEVYEIGDYIVGNKRERIIERKNCIVGHLCSPINENDALFLVNNDINQFVGCKRHTELKRRLNKFKYCYHIADSENGYKDPIKYLQDWIKTEQVSSNRRLEAIKHSVKNFTCHKMDFLKPTWRGNNELRNFLVAENKQMENHVEVAIMDLRLELEDMMKAEKIKDAICFKDIFEGRYISHRNLMAEPDICILKRDEQTAIVFSTNLLLCALDKVQSRFNLLLYTKIADVKRKYEGISMYKHCVKLIDIFEKLRSKIGNDFFEIMNAYESLIVGWVVANPEDLGCQDLYYTGYNDILDVLERHNLDSSWIDQVLPPNRSENMTKMYIEFTGLVKVFGYPILNAETTLEHILKYGIDSDQSMDPDHISNLSGMIRKRFLINYHRKCNRIPPIVECPSSLVCLLEGKMPDKKVSLSEWSQLKFGKCLDYDYSPDQADLIKDSSAAVSKSSWPRMYDPCAFRVRYGKKPPRSPESLYPTRVILNYLNASPDDVKRFVTDRDLGELNPEDHIYVECQKECELNKVGRAFTKQTPPQRLIQTSMEHNIADQIFPFVPEQSMVDSEIKNIRRHLQQVKEMRSHAHFINIDLKKWCLHHRHMSSMFVGELYDEIFGLVSLYSSAHLFSHGCWVFPNHRLCPPDFDNCGVPIEGPLFTKSFIGGMEGMQQKKWTHGAITNIQYVSEICNQACEIMAQGDNIVILLIFSKDDAQAEVKRTAFLKQLELCFRKMGHKLKEKETWFSSKLHEYSKQRMYEGCSVSYSLKKCAKVIPDINDGLFSIPSSLSTINTITEGIARADYDPDIAFFLNSINIINYLDRKSMLTGRNPLNILTMLNWPVDFGGINVSCYHSHVVRGNDDKVCIWLSLLATFRELNLDLYNSVLKVWWLAPERPASNSLERRNLYEDIYSLNIPQHPSAEFSIKEKVVKFLKSDCVTNPSIKYLYDDSHSVSYESIIKEGDKIEPSYPPLIHELLKNSNAGLLLRLQGKLTKSKTLEKVINLEKGESLIDLIRSKNAKLILSVESRFKTSRYDRNKHILGSTGFCPTEIANKLRELSWGRTIIGVTKPCWMHQCLLLDQDNCTTAQRNKGITVRVSGDALDQPSLCHKIYGPMKPFVGSKTKEKITKGSTISIQEKTNSTKAYMRLIKIEGWIHRLGDDNIMELIHRLKVEKEHVFSKEGLTVIDQDNDELIMIEGNLFHRFKSSIERDTAMVNSLPSVTGHFEYSSNSMKEMTAGGKDFSIFYQYIYTSCTEVLAMMGRIMGSLKPGYMILFSECDCMMETPNPTLSMPSLGPTSHPRVKDSRDINVHTNVDVNYVRRAFSAQLGKQLGINIDNNYRIAHGQHGTDNQLNEYRKEQISINDMRQMDFVTVLNHAFFSSSHCKMLMDKSSLLAICLSEDRSFLYLAELILESDLISELILLFKSRTNEHGGITSVFGISSYISRNVGRYMRSVLKNPRDLVIYRFRDDNLSLFLAFLKRIYLMMLKGHSFSEYTKEELRVEFDSTKNLSRIMKLIGLTFIYVPKNKSDIVRMWKTCDRGTQIKSDVIYKSILVKPPSNQFPYTDVLAYHLERKINHIRPRLAVEPVVKVSQASFLCRKVGAISSAGNKALEALVATGVYFYLAASTGLIICTAEGSGSILLILYLVFSKATFMYNTWMRPDISHRDKANDKCIPAIVDSGVDPSRISDDDSLITGETDITKPDFFNKFKRVLVERKPVLVTMDAESTVESNNWQFMEKFVIPALRIHQCFFLVKLFHMVKLSPIITEALSEFPSIRWVLYKPLSSNPVGPEVYLVISPIASIERMASFTNCKRMFCDVEDYLCNNMQMVRADLDMYVTAAKRVGSFLQAFFPNQDINLPSKYDAVKTIETQDRLTSQFCSILCPKFFELLTTLIDLIHNNIDDPTVHLLTRSKGTNGVLYQMIHDYLFLCMYHHMKINNSFFLLFFNLASIKVRKDIQSVRAEEGIPCLDQCNPNNGDVWSTWRDARSFVRALGNQEGPCLCKPTRRVWTWDSEKRFALCNSISYCIYKWLWDRGFVPSWHAYHLMRIEPRHVSSKILKSPICN